MTGSEEVDDCHNDDDALGEDTVLKLILLVPDDPGVTSDWHKNAGFFHKDLFFLTILTRMTILITNEWTKLRKLREYKWSSFLRCLGVDLSQASPRTILNWGLI